MGTAAEELFGKRIHMRRYRSEDANILYLELGCNPEMERYIEWNPYGSLYSTHIFLSEIASSYEDANAGYAWVIEDDGDVVGVIGAYAYSSTDGSIEIIYNIFQRFWRKGYVSEALSVLCDYLENLENMKCLNAWSPEESIASSRVLLKNGFVKTEQRVEAKSVNGEAFSLVQYKKQIVK